MTTEIAPRRAARKRHEMISWRSWITQNWQALCAGEKLCVPQYALPQPSSVPGFKQVDGWPANQTCDWATPIDDGSRVHVQCYTRTDGTPMFCVHRDKWDPDRDFGSAVMHAIFETPAGQVAGILGALGLIATLNR